MLGDLDLGLGPPTPRKTSPAGADQDETPTADDDDDDDGDGDGDGGDGDDVATEDAGAAAAPPAAGPQVDDELAAALNAAAEAADEDEDATPVHDLSGESDLGLDLDESPVSPEAIEFEEEAADGPSPLEASVASAADGPVDDESPFEVSDDDGDVGSDDAPPLPVGDGEPPPVSAISAAGLEPDENTLAALKKLAGPSTTPEETRTALHAALKGEPYDPHALPDTRALVLGVARVLVATGFSVNEIVDGIMAAMSE
jgi:hypothetical protein